MYDSSCLFMSISKNILSEPFRIRKGCGYKCNLDLPACHHIF